MDLTIILAELLGTDLATIGRVLAWLLVIALARTALAKAGVDRGIETAREWLGRRRVSARTTRTMVDDYAVHLGSYALEGVAVVLAVGMFIVWLVAWITPRFALGMRAAQQQLEDEKAKRRRPPSGLLGLLTWAVIALGVVVLVLGPLALSGCGARGSDTTPLHRAGTAASVLVDTGVFVGEELTREIGAEVLEARDTCRAADDGRDCDAVGRLRADEYRVLAASHNAYATLVNELVGELQVQAGRQEAGEEPDMAQAARLAGRVRSAYASLAELLRLVDIPAPDLPAGVIEALEAIQ